jgi:hypothetical protein
VDLPAQPGATHDLTAARELDVIDALTTANMMTFTDRGYPDAGGTLRTPLNATATDHHCRTATTPGSAPPANAPSPPSRPGRSSPSCTAAPSAATPLLAAILVLQLIEEQRRSSCQQLIGLNPFPCD